MKPTWTPQEKIVQIAVLQGSDLGGDIMDVVATLNSYIFLYQEYDRLEIRKVIEPGQEYSIVIGITIETDAEVLARLGSNIDDLNRYEKWKTWQKLNNEYQMFKLRESP